MLRKMSIMSLAAVGFIAVGLLAQSPADAARGLEENGRSMNGFIVGRTNGGLEENGRSMKGYTVYPIRAVDGHPMSSVTVIELPKVGSAR